jgi:ribosomal subunit interface protein
VWRPRPAQPRPAENFPGDRAAEAICSLRRIAISRPGQCPGRSSSKETNKNIRISGQQIDLGAALQDHARKRLPEVAGKYFARAVDAWDVFKRDGDRFKADIAVHANTRTAVNAGADSLDIYRAFDEALLRIAKRLRRHKRWLNDHSSGEKPAVTPPGSGHRAAVRHALVQWDGERHDEAPSDAVVVAELETPVEDATVADAVRLLDLGEEPALMFRNAGTAAINVVYRRTDGNIGWIEP